MDYGFVPGTDAQDDRMRELWDRRTPAVTRRTIPSNVREFIRDLHVDSGVTKPVDNLLIGAHASSEGYIFIPLYAGQVDPVTGLPTNQTDYEALEWTLDTAHSSDSIAIPDTLIGYADPPGITRSVHFKGCNVGRDRFSATPPTPRSPFLTKFKEAFGNHVHVTAPKHFHGISTLDNGEGVFEYMAHEWVVRTKATRVSRGRYRGFANRAALVAGYQGRTPTFEYADRTTVANTSWTGWIPPQTVLPASQGRANAHFKWPRDMSLSLGPTPVGGLPSLTVGREFRSYLEEIPWDFPAPPSPATEAQRMAALRTSLSSDSRFAPTHAWPAFERLDYADFNAFFNGHLWEFTPSTTAGNIVATGRRFDYTILEPITSRPAPPARPVLVFNFYPTTGTTHTAVTNGLVESDTTYFGRS